MTSYSKNFFLFRFETLWTSSDWNWNSRTNNHWRDSDPAGCCRPSAICVWAEIQTDQSGYRVYLPDLPQETAMPVSRFGAYRCCTRAVENLRLRVLRPDVQVQVESQNAYQEKALWPSWVPALQQSKVSQLWYVIKRFLKYQNTDLRSLFLKTFFTR